MHITGSAFLLIGICFLLSAPLTLSEQSLASKSTDTQHLERKTIDFAPGVSAEFVYIDAPAIAQNGFLMGSPKTELDRNEDENQFRVDFTKGYWIQTTEVTQAQWKAVMGSVPENLNADFHEKHPIYHVSFSDVRQFLSKAQRSHPLLELPTEAQWEFACRAGTTSRYSWGNDLGKRNANAGDYLHADRHHEWVTPVATFRPNAWGLYDMHGNVWEWCRDWYDSYPTERTADRFISAAPKDDSDPSRILRGGGAGSLDFETRSASRLPASLDDDSGWYGFRLVLTSE